MKTSLLNSERNPAGTFRLYGKVLFAGLIFFVLYFAPAASSLNAAGTPAVRIILVNTEKEAGDITAEVAKGRPFASLAKERSIDEKSRDHFGEIDSADLDSLDRQLKEAALRLREGQVSGVLKLADKRYAIVLVVDMAHYRSGARAFKSGDFELAKMNFLKHIELNPDAVKARILLGRISEAANDAKEAESNYKEALRFDPGREEAYQRLGELYIRTGQFQQAKDLYEEGLRNLPGSKPLVTGLKKAKGRLLTAGSDQPKGENKKMVAADRKTPERVEEAASAPETAKPGKEVPDSVSSKDGTSSNVISQNRNERKMQIRIIFTDKESDAREILSEVKKGKSFALFAKEKSIDEKTRETYGYLGEISLESLHAAMQEALSNLSEGQISDVIKIHQNRYAIIHITETGLYKEAEKAFIAGDLATAEANLVKYVESNPDAVKARTMLGKIYEDRNEPSKAIVMYREAISFSPKTVLIYERLARVYLFLGMYTKAKNVYIQGLKQVPSSPELEEGIEVANMLMIGEGERVP